MSGMKDAFLGDTDYLTMFAPFQPHSSTSYEAAKAITPRLPALQRRVLEYFKDHPNGATDEQLIDALGMSASTIRPRRIELVEQGLLLKTERYALTKSGRRATVWQLTPQPAQGTRSSVPLPD